MRIVLDTNVLISALITQGKPRELLNNASEGKFQLVLSKAIIDEFLRVYNEHQKVSRYANREEVALFIKAIKETAEITKVTSNFAIVKDDPNDNIILETAFDGKTGFIVSGDKHLLSLKEFRGIKICTIDEMLKTIKE